MRRVCVFCGSSPGANPNHLQLAKHLGALLARRRLTLVYGGGCVGLMGALADAVLAHRGEVIGVIPQALAVKEVAHMGLPDLRIVASMHERKALMADLADAFIALPGGLGTLDEFFEIVTWAQLGLHQKPCGLINLDNYFADLIRFLDHAVADRFVRPEHRALVLVEEDPERLLERFGTYRAPRLEKWIDRGNT
jgi:uncharacterized protein (TIGR00730 family)